MKLYIFLGNCFLYINSFRLQLFSSWFFILWILWLLMAVALKFLEKKSSLENHVFWIIKYLKVIFLFFSQRLPSFPKQNLFHATTFDSWDQNLSLMISRQRSPWQCVHHFYHTALFMCMYHIMFGDYTGPAGLSSAPRNYWGFSDVTEDSNCSLFKSRIQELWNKLWVDTDVVCLSGACVVVVEISADQHALQKTCGVPSKGEEGFVRQAIFKTCLHHCWRDAEVVPHNITLQQEKPQLTQRQTTGEMM